jgi:hypothetical protein
MRRLPLLVGISLFLCGCASNRSTLPPYPRSITSTCPFGWVDKLAVVRVIARTGDGPKTQSLLKNAALANGRGATAWYDDFRIPWPRVIGVLKLRPAPTQIDRVFVNDSVFWTPIRGRGLRLVLFDFQNPEGRSQWLAFWSSDTEQMCLLPAWSTASSSY